MIDTKLIMGDTSNLIRACFEKKNFNDLSIDKKELLFIASAGDMQYLLLYPLIKNETDIGFTDKIKDILKQITFIAYAQAMCAKQITELFEKEKLRHQFLKGSVIKKIYPAPEMRQMSDVDIIIFDESLDRAAKLLESNGYVNRGLEKHHMIFTSPFGVCVELHWCLYDQNVDYGQYLYFKDTFRSQLVENHSYTYEFGVEDFYIYMIAHMAKHFFETGCGIRNLLDIYVYTKKYDKQMDNRYLTDELQKCGLYDFEKNMKILSYIWMEQRECPAFFENLFEYMVQCGIYGDRKNGVWGQLAKETGGNKAIFKVRYYFPSIAFMKEKYPWLSNKSFLLPIAWLLRGTSGMWSRQSGEHAQLIKKTDKKEIEKMLEIYHRMNLDFRKYSKEAKCE